MIKKKFTKIQVYDINKGVEEGERIRFFLLNQRDFNSNSILLLVLRYNCILTRLLVFLSSLMFYFFRTTLIWYALNYLSMNNIGYCIIKIRIKCCLLYFCMIVHSRYFRSREFKRTHNLKVKFLGTFIIIS